MAQMDRLSVSVHLVSVVPNANRRLNVHSTTVIIEETAHLLTKKWGAFVKVNSNILILL